MSNSTRTLLHMCFGQKAPLHLSLSHSGEQGEGGGGRGGWMERIPFVLAAFCTGVGNIQAFTVH